MKETGIAFDLEGPLIDLEREGHHAAHLKSAEVVGLKLTIEEAIEKIPHFLGGPDEAVARDIYELGNKSLTSEQIYSLKNALFKTWLEKVEQIPVREGLFQFLDKLKEKKIPMCIGTAASLSQAMDYVQRSGLDKYFDRDRIVTADDVKNNKPAPDIYLKTARIMGIDPKKQLVFEDSGRGVSAGIAAESTVIGMPIYYIPQVIAKLKNAEARAVYSKWQEVNINDYIADAKDIVREARSLKSPFSKK